MCETLSAVAICSTCSGDRSPSSIASISPFSLRRLKNSFFCARRGAHLHQRPGVQDVFLHRGTDPPHGVGREAEAAIRIEALDRLHESDIALGNQLAHRQPVAAIAHRDLGHQAQVAGHEPVRGFRVIVLAPALGQHELLLGREERKLANHAKVAGDAAPLCGRRYRNGAKCHCPIPPLCETPRRLSGPASRSPCCLCGAVIRNGPKIGRFQGNSSYIKAL